MTRQQAEQFISIYNTLLTISTKGEDTKKMAKVLETIESLANEIQVVPDPVETPIVESGEEGKLWMIMLKSFTLLS